MSQENVEIVRALFEAWGRKDIEKGRLAACHPGPCTTSRDLGAPRVVSIGARRRSDGYS